MAYLTAALYKFVALDRLPERRSALLDLCAREGVMGTLLLAPEGINGTVAGPEAGVQALLAQLRQDPLLADLEHKASWSAQMPFHRLKVRLKREIVTLRVPGLDPTQTVGRYVAPQDWNALISQPDVVLVDTRNDYEVAIGTFQGARNPGIKTFTDLPAWLEAQPDLQGERPAKVAMFCTGGIRCEKSTALLRQRGFDEVYHLRGGILKYLEEVPPEQSLWQGECFVFDERVSVGHGLAQGPHELCRACRWPLSPQDRASKDFERGVSCPHCAGTREPQERQRLAERQRQVELAARRGQRHVGAVMPSGASGPPSPIAAAAAGEVPAR